jgi:integrase
MRWGEALGLRWSDLDFDAARLCVVQTIIRTRSTATIGEPTSTRCSSAEYVATASNG